VPPGPCLRRSGSANVVVPLPPYWVPRRLNSAVYCWMDSSWQDRKDIATFCRATEITYVAGAEDHLPRQLRIAADFDKQTLTALAASSGDDSTKELDRLNVELDIKLTQWGKDVSYKAPADPKSMDDLGMAVLGLLFQAAS
jgi:hypothetical protein